MRGGVYNENVTISPSGGYSTGQPNRPITVKAYPGETPTVRATSSGSTIRLDSGITDWVIDGLTIGGSSVSVAGIFVNGADHVTIQNCRFDSTIPQRTSYQLDAIKVDAGAEDTSDQEMCVRSADLGRVEAVSGNSIQIRENEFVGCYRHCIQSHGSAKSRT